jgi:hypothetical protein
MFKITDASNKSDEQLNESDLSRLITELEELQLKFSSAAVKKYKLNKELESCVLRLESATSIIER